ncbi:hypothetical protein MUK42_28682 [Musa troglodytarum]|uniref:Uncharacterized protein n=1 Tax=Musa troglodytarum TaxID=320322 RepID=A0A9E7FI03_9LILI|nr:hypothetical protein MUK42_28682 [Musa troglodytarum]
MPGEWTREAHLASSRLLIFAMCESSGEIGGSGDVLWFTIDGRRWRKLGVSGIVSYHPIRAGHVGSLVDQHMDHSLQRGIKYLAVARRRRRGH